MTTATRASRAEQLRRAADILNREVFVTIKPSPIHGVGIFAIQDIPEGERIDKKSELFERDIMFDRWTYANVLERHGLLPEIAMLYRQRWGSGFISRHINESFDHQQLMNFSRQPNFDYHSGRTLRLIRKGEELVENPPAYEQLFPIT